MDCMDEINDYNTMIRKDYYILKEREEGREHWVVFKDLNKILPVNNIKNGNLNMDLSKVHEISSAPLVIRSLNLNILSYSSSHDAA